MTTAQTIAAGKGTLDPVVRLRIEVVGEDGDACRRLLRDLCDMIDADLAGAPGYSVSKIEGSASCDVDTLPNAPVSGGTPSRPVACSAAGHAVMATKGFTVCWLCGEDLYKFRRQNVKVEAPK
jgi:hypothetical protein